MISDVLYEALCEIERYQGDSPRPYDHWKCEIEAAKTVMLALLTCLDATPGFTEEQNRLVLDLREAIKNLDLSAVRAARQRLLCWVEETRRKHQEKRP